MLSTYMDIGLQPVDLQRAAAQSLQTQQDKSLAVQPAMDLRSAIETNMRNRRSGQTLALDERRLALAERTQEYNEGQLPWATVGAGAAAGLKLYGGWEALQDVNTTRAYYAQQAEIQRTTLQQARDSYARVLAALGKQQDVYRKVPDYTFDARRPTALPVGSSSPTQWAW